MAILFTSYAVLISFRLFDSRMLLKCVISLGHLPSFLLAFLCGVCLKKGTHMFPVSRNNSGYTETLHINSHCVETGRFHDSSLHFTKHSGDMRVLWSLKLAALWYRLHLQGGDVFHLLYSPAVRTHGTKGIVQVFMKLSGVICGHPHPPSLFCHNRRKESFITIFPCSSSCWDKRIVAFVLQDMALQWFSMHEM